MYGGISFKFSIGGFNIFSCLFSNFIVILLGFNLEIFYHKFLMACRAEWLNLYLNSIVVILLWSANSQIIYLYWVTYSDMEASEPKPNMELTHLGLEASNYNYRYNSE